MFTDDRELIRCPKCGLMEDVLCGGFLVTYHEEGDPSPAAKLDRPWAGRRDRGGAVMVLGYGAAWPG